MSPRTVLTSSSAKPSRRYVVLLLCSSFFYFMLLSANARKSGSAYESPGPERAETLKGPSFPPPEVSAGTGDTNSPPHAVDDLYTVHRSLRTSNAAPPYGVLRNDSDPDGDNIVCEEKYIVTPHGSASVSSDGTVGYDPAHGFVGTETMTYRVCDGHGGCSSATITFNVVNQAPTVVGDRYRVHGYFQTNKSQGPFGVLHNDSDLDGDSYACEEINNLITPHGSASVTANGDVTYSPTTGFVGTDTITYRVCDSLGACSEGRITFDVVNSPPTVIDDFYVVRGTGLDTAANAPPNSVLNNDSDPDGDNMACVRINNVRTAHGYVTVDDFGRVSYSPDTGFVGADSVVYEVSDNLAAVGSGRIWFFVIGGGENFGSFPCGSVGKPVNVTTGNTYLEQIDYRLPGMGNGLEIVRAYNSDSSRIGLFGKGWVTAYDEAITVYDDNLLRLELADGRAIYFGRGDDGPFQPLTPGFYGQITKEGTEGYKITFNDGRIHRFDPSGRLIAGSDRNNNQTTLTYDAEGRLSRVTDASGRELTVSSNAEGRVAALHDAVGPVASYSYGALGALQSVAYPDGSGFDFSYAAFDSKLLLTTVRNALGQLIEAHEYDGTGRATTSETAGGVERYTLNYVRGGETHVTDALGRVTKYFFDTSKGRNVVTRTEGPCECGGATGSSAQTWTFDAQLNVLTKTNGLNQTTIYTYDAAGNELSKSDVLGTTRYTHNQSGQVLTATDPLGAVTGYTYDERGNLLSVTNAMNRTATLAYDARGLLVSVTNPRSKTTRFSYDTYGNLVQSTNAAGHATTFTYDGRGRLASETNALGHMTRYDYDLAGRLIRITGGNDASTTIAYDLAGRRANVTDARGNTTSFGYDNAGRLIRSTDAAGGVISFDYDLMSNLIGSADTHGRITNYEFDDFNQLVRVIYPSHAPGATRLEERLEYDAVGNVTKRIDRAGRATLFEYDPANRLVKVIDAASQITRYEYNAVSEITAMIDALGQRYEFVYNKVGLLKQMRRGAQMMAFTYDAAGNRKQRIDYNGALTAYSYNALNQLTRVTYPDTTTVRYTYDRLGRPKTASNPDGTLSFGYNRVSLLTSISDALGQTVTYTYDLNGNRTKASLDGTTLATYRYDVLNRPTKLIDDTGSATNFTFDAISRLTSRRLPNGMTTNYEYDGLNRLTRLRTTRGLNVIDDRQFQYDDADQITQIHEPRGLHTYGYDSLDRLTTASNPAAPSELYAYDGVGNRTMSHLSPSYGYDPFNRLIQRSAATYSYDNNGNLTSKWDSMGAWTYSWDFENRLTSVVRPDGSSIAYRYDALGRRIQRAPSLGFSTTFTYDGADVVLDQNSDGSSVKYLNGPGIDNKLRQTSGTGTHYFVQDQQGSTRVLTGATGNVVARADYDAFGNGATPPQTRYGFTGRERDGETDLYYYRARWYDPQLGRFISEDPIGLSGGVNQYSYVSGNPINRNDPLGLYEIDVHYYLTYYLAKKNRCFTDAEAHLIAEANQGTDEISITMPARGTNAEQKRKNREYHALHSGAVEGVGSAALWGDTMRGDTNYVALGRYLHYLQDTFSHEGFASDTWGHSPLSAFGGDKWGTHATDKTDEDLPKAMRMAGATWGALNDYARAKKCGCQGQWNDSWWQQVSDFARLPGGMGVGRWIDSVEDLSPVYIELKRSALGLPLR